MRWALAVLLLAAALRFPKLAERPMHADEAIQADRLGILRQTGSPHYDPADYHGPALAIVSLPAAWIAGAKTYQQFREVTVRVVPAVFGLLVVLISFLIGRRVSREAGLLAAFFAALSRGMVYFSRDYIPEMLLVFFSAALLYSLIRYSDHGNPLWAAASGASAGLMFATKETAVLSLAAAAVAAVALRPRVGAKAALAAAAAACLILVAFYGPSGAAAALRSPAIYAGKALHAGGHAQPWYAYLKVLAQSGDGVFVLLAFTALFARGRLTTFLFVYSAVLTVAYSAIQYKTPWCVLGFLHGWILLSAIGISRLRLKWKAAAPAAALLAILLGGNGPYRWVETQPDVFLIRDAIDNLARNHPAGKNVPIQIFTTENLWPLPWYLRAYPNVQWWRGVPGTAPRAPLILLSPAMEPAVTRLLYDLPPPGQRELYVPMFPRTVWLREGTEVRGYAAYSLASR
jgi:uncharacterized protein (TIGR03663 family)